MDIANVNEEFGIVYELSVDDSCLSVESRAALMHVLGVVASMAYSLEEATGRDAHYVVAYHAQKYRAAIQGK